ncbi:MAG: hypothetical protein ACE366_25405 [Bradymonadia bacterium]
MKFAILALLTMGAITGLVIRGVNDAQQDVFTSYKLAPVTAQLEDLQEQRSRLNIDREYELEPGRLARAAAARGLATPLPHEVIQVPVDPFDTEEAP